MFHVGWGIDRSRRNSFNPISEISRGGRFLRHGAGEITPVSAFRLAFRFEGDEAAGRSGRPITTGGFTILCKISACVLGRCRKDCALNYASSRRDNIVFT
jgi:hypothetical protein